ncbi:MAG: ParA family protein [Chitinivibrionales bacterium]
MKKVAIINHKGGVGKTTFTGCIGQALSLTGFRVLLVDNDSQHNLSTLLGTGVHQPNIRDVYLSDPASAPATFLKAIRKTEIAELHIVTAPSLLSGADVTDTGFLAECLRSCGLERFYDFLLIDNAPGIDTLQSAAIHAVDEIFVPTELRQFAIDGLAEMEQIIRQRFPSAAPVTRIIPNFYKDTKRHNTFLLALHRLFPGRVTQTAIPIDSVFDEMVTEEKILFLHRLYSKGAAYYLKLMHELFDLDEAEIWQTMIEKRKERLSEDARQRFYQQRSQVSSPDKGERQ